MSLSNLPARAEYDHSRRFNIAQLSPGLSNDSLDLSSIITDASSEYQYKASSTPSTKRRNLETAAEYFYEEVDESWTEIMLMMCCVTSGILNVVTYKVLGVFYGMQTGNTIILAMHIALPPSPFHHPLNYLKSLVSIGSYCFGAFVFNCLHKAPAGLSTLRPPLHRWTLTCSFLIQAALVSTVAILAQTGLISSSSIVGAVFTSGPPKSPGSHYLDLLSIAILAFESAGQVCLSRVLGVAEIPTIVFTLTYHDLVGESLGTRKCWRESRTWRRFFESQKKQIRRVVCAVVFFGSALVGGFVFSSSKAGFAAALWIAAGVKVLICIAWCLWKGKGVTEIEDGDIQQV
ncbi:hypothetical protein Vi05172_g5718 [Venturia inaequalis]|nr:hypothetical protein Vi05172_g5718 [Venturia inaequalis]